MKRTYLKPESKTYQLNVESPILSHSTPIDVSGELSTGKNGVQRVSGWSLTDWSSDFQLDDEYDY